MNEIDFVKLTRTLKTGDVVLAWTGADPAAALFPGAPLAPSIVAAGCVLEFVDPAKPLLVFQTRTSAPDATALAVYIDFFHDALYAASPVIRAERFAVWRTTQVNAAHWIAEIQSTIGRPYATDTDRFEAYAAGALSRRYADPRRMSDDVFGSWLTRTLDVLEVDRGKLSRVVEPAAIWENHDVYSFR